MFAFKKDILCFTVLLLALSACGGEGTPSSQSGDIFDRFDPTMTAEDVKEVMGDPASEDENHLYYADVELCGLTGELEVDIGYSEPTVYFVEWTYDTGDRRVRDCTEETQAIYDHFVEKFGEAERRDNSYMWYATDNQGPAGSPRYMLELDSNPQKIRMFVDFEG